LPTSWEASVLPSVYLPVLPVLYRFPYYWERFSL